MAISANTLEEIEAALKDPSKLTTDEIEQLMQRRKEGKGTSQDAREPG